MPRQRGCGVQDSGESNLFPESLSCAAGCSTVDRVELPTPTGDAGLENPSDELLRRIAWLRASGTALLPSTRVNECR
jgi:hypothetical protein